MTSDRHEPTFSPLANYLIISSLAKAKKVYTFDQSPVQDWPQSCTGLTSILYTFHLNPVHVFDKVSRGSWKKGVKVVKFFDIFSKESLLVSALLCHLPIIHAYRRGVEDEIDVADPRQLTL